ncbi:hypothetical protein C8R46DRAFT_1344314 [Mycena filopes]|nr:hypothetical protein C8R46DRAFT_1344314 [Mycena filopes]
MSGSPLASPRSAARLTDGQTEFLGLPPSESMVSSDISIILTPSEPLSASPTRSAPIAPKSPEFASNRPRDAPQPQRPRPHLASSSSAKDSEWEKTPNVYINGLPPNFSDEQLLAITAPFGEVVSVRTFTRTNTQTPSGYGFVLFKELVAAEKCIMALKRSDLHPSFSKVNKPPRIVCSPNEPSLPARSSSSSLASSDRESLLSPGSSAAFKLKMAQLADGKSTNVYIEGLPLSADKNTLIALVYPHIIQSTRFIRSKLPESPTMIAFMRMDSRAAAEDVILRLNGKKVRGWDDVESRVYLRIADTLDQRELRRTEAAIRDEEPGRMSIAQATLLSYRGKEQFQLPNSGGGGLPFASTIPDNNNNPNLLAAHVHGLLTGNPRARAPPAYLASAAGHRHDQHPIQQQQQQGYHHQQPQQHQPQGIPNTLPHPLAANIHSLLTFGAAARPDPLYAPYASQQPQSQPFEQYHNYNHTAYQNQQQQQQRGNGNGNGALHPNVAALFDGLAALRMQQEQQRVLAQQQQQRVLPRQHQPALQHQRVPPVLPQHQPAAPQQQPQQPMAGFPNQFNVGGNLGGAVPGPGKREAQAFRRLPEENLGVRRVNSVAARPRPNFGPPAPPVLVSGKGKMKIGAQRTGTAPRPASSLVQVSAALPARPLPAPPPAQQQIASPVMSTTATTTADNAAARTQTWASAHARASTAPVRLRRRCDSPVDDLVAEAAALTKDTTTTTMETKMNANTNMKNMNTNTNPHANNNVALKLASGGPGASTRVFLGPQNVMRLPVLRFA